MIDLPEDIHNCPRCKGSGLSGIVDESDYWPTEYYIACNNCGRRGTSKATKEGAITAWNKIEKNEKKAKDKFFVRLKGRIERSDTIKSYDKKWVFDTIESIDYFMGLYYNSNGCHKHIKDEPYCLGHNVAWKEKAQEKLKMVLEVYPGMESEVSKFIDLSDISVEMKNEI
jgi:hypothetical protein